MKNTMATPYVRFARQAHRTALWASGMKKKFPDARPFYAAMERRNRKEARDLMRCARRVA